MVEHIERQTKQKDAIRAALLRCQRRFYRINTDFDNY